MLISIYNVQVRDPRFFEYNRKVCNVDKFVVVAGYAIQKSCFRVSGVLVSGIYSNKLGTVLNLGLHTLCTCYILSCVCCCILSCVSCCS
jgi:hypothetical protein